MDGYLSRDYIVWATTAKSQNQPKPAQILDYSSSTPTHHIHPFPSVAVTIPTEPSEWYVFNLTPPRKGPH